MSCMVVRWKPWREKQTMAACRICLRRALRCAWLTLGMQAPGRSVLLYGERVRCRDWDMSDRYVIELVAFHLLGIGAVKLRAILACGGVAIQLQASLPEKFGNGARIETEGPGFSQLFDIVEQLRCSFEVD